MSDDLVKSLVVFGNDLGVAERFAELPAAGIDGLMVPLVPSAGEGDGEHARPRAFNWSDIKLRIHLSCLTSSECSFSRSNTRQTELLSRRIFDRLYYVSYCAGHRKQL